MTDPTENQGHDPLTSWRIMDYLELNRQVIAGVLDDWEKAVGDDGSNDEEHEAGYEMAAILQGLKDILDDPWW